MTTFNLVAQEVQETLDWLTDRAAAESLPEVIELVNTKAPTLCQEVKLSWKRIKLM
jgi:hypothetical protein